MVRNVSMIIVQDQIRSLFIFFVYNLDLLSLLHCFFVFALFFFVTFRFVLYHFFFFFLIFFILFLQKNTFVIKYRDFPTLCARQRIGVVVIASVVVDVVVGVVVGIVASLCHWCSCGIALRASWYSCRWYCIVLVGGLFVFFLLHSYRVVLLVSLAFV